MEMTPNPQEITSALEEYPHPGTPTLDFSPADKIYGGEVLMPPTSWPSLYYYSPVATNVNPELPESGQTHNTGISLKTYACFGTPQLPTPSYATYFDCASLPGAEFIPESADPETSFVGVPSGPIFGDGNELQVAVDGGGSTVLASGNTFRDAEASLDYVTLHIPANAVTSNTDYPLGITNDNSQSIILTNDNEEDKPGNLTNDSEYKTTSEIVYDEAGNLTSRKLREVETYEKNISITSSSTTQMQTICNNKLTTDDLTMIEDLTVVQNKNVSENNSLNNDLERQDLTVTGVALREPIVISQTKRICVLMDTPNPDSDGKELTSL
jgi:hypothetical protein